MWPFCGLEHYPNEELGRYRVGYTKESRSKDDKGWDVNRWEWKRKQRIFKQIKNLTIVTPSRWLSSCVKESAMFKDRRIETIPYGIDTEIFKPINKQEARRILNLPLGKKLVLFGATRGTDDPRKGFVYLRDALNKIVNSSGLKEDLELLIFGAGEPREKTNFGAKATYLGRIYDAATMALIYSAADVFVIPSIQDNLPNTVLESLACGTPVVGFKIGGIPDMITHCGDGYLANAFESDDLATGISWVLGDRDRYGKLCLSARRKAVSEYGLDIQAQRYISLYKSLL